MFWPLGPSFLTIVQCFAVGTILPVSKGENLRFHSSVRRALLKVSGKFLVQMGALTLGFQIYCLKLFNFLPFLRCMMKYNIRDATLDEFHCPQSAIVHSSITPWICNLVKM